MLQVSSTAALATGQQSHDEIEPIAEPFSRSDWTLFSVRGLLAALQLAVSVFTKETYHVVPTLASVDDITVLCVSHMLRQDFLEYISQKYDFLSIARTTTCLSRTIIYESLTTI